MIYLASMRMWKNRWLMLALLLGTIIAITIVCVIPIYAQGITQRMLITELQNAQTEDNTHAGEYTFELPLNRLYPENMAEGYQAYDQRIREQLIPSLNMSALLVTQKVKTPEYLIAATDLFQVTPPSLEFCAYSSYDNSVDLLYGKMPSAQLNEQGAIEVMVSKNMEIKYDLNVGRTYDCYLEEDQENPFYCIVVGVYEPITEGYTHLYDASMLDASLLCDMQVMESFFVQRNLAQSVGYHLVLDYTQLKIENVQSIIDVNKAEAKWLNYYNVSTYSIPKEELFEPFLKKQEQISTIILLFELPILLLIAFYLIMVSNLVINNDKNEISLLRSRGTSWRKLLLGYLFQSLILAGISMAAAPFLAMYTSALLGRVSGFLEFGNQIRLEVQLLPVTWIYAVCGGLFVILTILCPVLMAFRYNIVKLKLQKSAKTIPFWKKYYLDLVLLALSFYGYFGYLQRQKSVFNTGGEAQSIPIDPLAFLILFLFALGAGLLFIRLYSPIMMLLFRITKKKLSPVGYTSILQAGRMKGQEQYLLIFLVITLIIGIFCANSARSMNTGIDDKFYYETGTDVVVDLNWNTVALEENDQGLERDEIYKPFLFNTIKGIDKTTKVIKGFHPKAIYQGTEVEDVRLMGISTKEFSELAWMREDLNETHINEYLNLLGANPMACLISKALMKELGLKNGDALTLIPSQASSKGITFIVYESVEYWPTYNPYAENNMLIIANSDYIDYMMPNLDYDVWMTTKAGASLDQITQDIKALQYKVNKVDAREYQQISLQNDAARQGTNGVLTLGFLVIAIICIFGFVIYWVLSIRARTLQIATLRAMGLPKGAIYRMLICEQVLLSGAAIIMGIVLAGVASDLFVPVLQVAFDASLQVPPMRIVYKNADYYKIYAFVALMLTVASAVIFPMVKKLKLAQAIKLGEE